jgi:hypothetical protein
MIDVKQTDDPAAAGGANDVTPATKTYTQAEFEAAVAGLKSNNDKLLAEKKAATAAAKEAADAKLAAEQAAAKQSGELEAFEKSLRGQYEPLIKEREDKLAKMSQRILDIERKSISSELVSKGRFIDPTAADLLAPFIKTEFDGESVVTQFIGPDGRVITTDVDQFIAYCKKHPVISHLMQADVGTGGGAAGNKNPSGGAAGNLDAIDRRLREKFKK